MSAILGSWVCLLNLRTVPEFHQKCFCLSLLFILDSSSQTSQSWEKINNNPCNKDNISKTRWTASAKQASLEWIKFAIEENKPIEKELLEKLTTYFNNLKVSAPNSIKDELKQRLRNKGLSFKYYAESNKLQKLKNLRNQSNRNDKQAGAELCQAQEILGLLG